MNNTLIVLILSLAGLALLVVDLIRLRKFRNSALDLTIPAQVTEVLRTEHRIRALRRVDLLKKGATVQISFAGRLRTGIVRRAHTKRAEVMIPNKYGELFPVRRRIETLRLAA